MTTLDTLSPSNFGRIVNVTGSGAISQRLMEMGLIEGSTVEVIRLAPLGDPMQVSVHDYSLSLRKSEAALVEVELCG